MQAGREVNYTRLRLIQVVDYVELHAAAGLAVCRGAGLGVRVSGDGGSRGKGSLGVVYYIKNMEIRSC